MSQHPRKTGLLALAWTTAAFPTTTPALGVAPPRTRPLPAVGTAKPPQWSYTAPPESASFDACTDLVFYDGDDAESRAAREALASLAVPTLTYPCGVGARPASSARRSFSTITEQSRHVPGSRHVFDAVDATVAPGDDVEAWRASSCAPSLPALVDGDQVVTGARAIVQHCRRALDAHGRGAPAASSRQKTNSSAAAAAQRSDDDDDDDEEEEEDAGSPRSATSLPSDDPFLDDLDACSFAGSVASLSFDGAASPRPLVVVDDDDDPHGGHINDAAATFFQQHHVKKTASSPKLVVDDGPTTTHGGDPITAGMVVMTGRGDAARARRESSTSLVWVPPPRSPVDRRKESARRAFLAEAARDAQRRLVSKRKGPLVLDDGFLVLDPDDAVSSSPRGGRPGADDDDDRECRRRASRPRASPRGTRSASPPPGLRSAGAAECAASISSSGCVSFDLGNGLQWLAGWPIRELVAASTVIVTLRVLTAVTNRLTCPATPGGAAATSPGAGVTRLL